MHVGVHVGRQAQGHWHVWAYPEQKPCTLQTVHMTSLSVPPTPAAGTRQGSNAAA